jgi:hypothetical protein
MRCSEVQANLSAFMDAELGMEQSKGVAEHLGTCAACTEEFHTLRQVVHWTHLIPEAEPPAQLPARILTAVHAVHPTAAARLWTALRQVAAPRQMVWATCAGAAAVLAVAMAGTRTQHPALLNPGSGERAVATVQIRSLHSPQAVETPAGKDNLPAAATEHRAPLTQPVLTASADHIRQPARDLQPNPAARPGVGSGSAPPSQPRSRPEQPATPPDSPGAPAVTPKPADSPAHGDGDGSPGAMMTWNNTPKEGSSGTGMSMMVETPKTTSGGAGNGDTDPDDAGGGVADTARFLRDLKMKPRAPEDAPDRRPSGPRGPL